MTTLNLLAAGWTWPAALIVVALIVAFGFVSVAAVSNSPKGMLMIGPERLEALEDDVAAMRADLTELKQSIAELDRLLKSVG